MKKNYQRPVVKAVKLWQMHIICESPAAYAPAAFSEKSSNRSFSRENRGGWDDEE